MAGTGIMILDGLMMLFGYQKTQWWHLMWTMYVMGTLLTCVYGKIDFRSQIPYPLNGHNHGACLANGTFGLCMFSLECRRIGGTASGVCRDKGFFGTCCLSPLMIDPSTRLWMHYTGQVYPMSSRQDLGECGKSKPVGEFESRIVNGVDTMVGEFPWQASLRIVTPFPVTISWCGAIVLTSQWVLTAAHCTRGIHARNLVVRYGGFSIFESLDPIKALERHVQEVIIHPEFIRLSQGHDIALVKVETPINFTALISPICLPGLGIGSLVGEKAIITGWGRGETEDDYPTYLQKAMVPILDNEKCEEMYREEGKQMKLTSNFMCAGYREGGTDSCQGDSGGPIQILGKNNRWFLAGVTSAGFMCAKPNLPGLYTRISLYVPWILDHILS